MIHHDFSHHAQLMKAREDLLPLLAARLLVLLLDDVSGGATSTGNWRAAERTSSLPVTTSATSRVRYSRNNAISRSRSSSL